MIQCFDSGIAKEYGLNIAIVLQNIFYWTEHNRANNANFHDGYYWTFNSFSAFQELFPYMSMRTIKSAIAEMKEKGLIITGNYNKSSYDRTNWYALTERAYALCKNCTIDITKSANGECEICTDNTNIYTNINTNNTKENISKERFVKPTISDIATYVQDKHYHVNAQQFFDFYESKGWMVGKNHMKNWKSAVNTWERNYKEKHPSRSVEDEYAGYEHYGFT